MKAEAKLVRELFEGEQCLVVPVFQRPYVWTRTKNWEPLWADVVAMADTLSRNPSAEPHFLGAVVLDSTEKDSADISVMQVIDGQQRITTLQIALCAVRDAFETAGIPRKFASAINKLTVNEDQLSSEKFAPYKVWPTLRDREAFTAIVDHKDTGDGDDSRLRDAYEFFFDETLAWLGEADSDHARIKSLVDALRTGLQLVSIELTGNDNAQVIFESLNDRGTPLLPSDLVKNSLFQLLERAGVDVEQAFDDHWRRLETTFWQEDVRQGRIIRSRLDAFFGHYLTMRTGEEVTTTGLFNRFKRLTSTMGRDELIEVLADIAECSETYRTIVDRSGTDVHDRLLETADALDTTVLAPVVLYLDRNAHVDDRVQAFGYIESWLVRRAVLRSTSKNYNRMLLDLLRVLHNTEGAYGDTVRTFFQSNTSESGRWPTDAEIREALVSAPIFKNLTRTRVQLVLRGCERGLATGHKDVTRSDLVYALLATADDDVDDIHRPSLGNLTLVPSAISRELGRAHNWESRRRILQSTDLRLNQTLPKTLSGVPISVRGSELATGFIRTWPHPDSVVPSDDAPETYPQDSAQGESGWMSDVWSKIEGFFADLPVGSVSRLEDRMEVVNTDGRSSLETLTQSPSDGFAFREIAGTLYVEKVRSATSTAMDKPDDENDGEAPAPAQSQGTDQQSTAQTRAVYTESISDLMRAGLITEGDRVYHEQPRKGTSFAAKITRAGQFLTGGRHYASPSTALSDLTGSSRNGWRDWRLERTGETLEQIRERFRRERESAE
ncbi:GmrSD restriction endonuclease domain-containing protein [Gordonia hongkongensis]|uniref:GmrSD restriction endonuclease domain-containing protein n=1 Tax=Gordonia hongkongensis TaxID=1701090 RepID=UPI003D7149C2